MTLLVCGGRSYANRGFLSAVLDGIHAAEPVTLLVHGAARGADTLAHEWAMKRGIACAAHPADWDTYGRAAGSLRNQEMLDVRHPDLVIAFPGGSGTADMVRRARAAQVPAICTA